MTRPRPKSLVAAVLATLAFAPAASAADTPSVVSAGSSYTCAVLAPAGRVACWGDDGGGQLGDGTDAPSPAPVFVSGVTGAVAVSAGQAHACAVLSDRTVACWGRLPDPGLGGFGEAVTAERVPGLSGATAVSAGARHTCALVTGGGVACWGQGSAGELGDGSTTGSAGPVAVSGIASAVAVSTGAGFSCAVLADGGVRCWGRGVDGELGNGGTSDSTTPVAVTGITSAVSVSAGTNHACALLASGGVTCWGSGDHGQLGDGGTSGSPTPVSVSGVSSATAIGAGGIHTCAVLAGGAIQCWGNGGDGELGNGTRSSSAAPVAVSGAAGATAVSGGLTHSCALASGQVRCWGSGDHGELGDGASRSSLVPVAVKGLDLSPPVFGESTVLQPVSGTVRVRAPGAKRFTRLRAGATLALGTTVDAGDGRVRLTSAADRRGRTQAGIFRSGSFKTSQTTEASTGLTVLTLAGALNGCDARASAAGRKKRRKRSLWGDAKGNFRTTGKNAAATVRGTRWLVEDTCEGTRVRVATGSVRVEDLVRHRTFVVTAPNSVLVRAGGRAQSARGFAVGMERLLSRLARGRTRLAGALGGALRCSVSPRTARGRVEDVIRNRTAIRDDLGALGAPTARAAKAARYLKLALDHSIAADRRYRAWLAELQRTNAGCPLPRTADFKAAAREDRRATRAKKRFVAAFGPIARKAHVRRWRASQF